MVKKEFTKGISHSGDDRLRLKIETEKGKVVDIVVQYEAKFADEWHPIVRYDCSHGFCTEMLCFLAARRKSTPWIFRI